MKSRLVLSGVIVTLLVSIAVGQTQRRARLNPMIELLQQKKPVLGLYAPSDRTGKTPESELAKQALQNRRIDFVFNGSMEHGDFEALMNQFRAFQKGMAEAGVLAKSPYPHLTHPLMLKIPKISGDPAKAIYHIGQQLNSGASGQMFVEAESAEEVRAGLAAMRFKSKGGTRADDVGSAPAYWGLSEAQYKQKADLWPLNPEGELVNWTIIESREGLAKRREIAAVKGIGVLWPGAGTLRQIFREDKDPQAAEKAIQSVLAACKEFNVPCGIPATSADIEKRIKEGFSVFVMNWGDDGFKTVEAGRRAGGRDASNDD